MPTAERLEHLKDHFYKQPFSHLWGMTLEMLKPGYARVSMSVKKEHMLLEDIVQGGITCVLIDWAGVFAAMSSIDNGHTKFVHLNVDMTHSALLGELLIAYARVIRSEGHRIWVDIEVFCSQGEHKSVASMTFTKPRD